ncbi:hypothetical protein K456DRAFT_931168 [Colletotrichum gloeosporioides 23]|nr:hypothetical protein K456DRAFT_931168 [Colletotrichum gloeosporioides 23]
MVQESQHGPNERQSRSRDGGCDSRPSHFRDPSRFGDESRSVRAGTGAGPFRMRGPRGSLSTFMDCATR